MQSPLPRTYLATMQVWDAECAARVARHRAMRQQKQFATVECPRGLEAIALPQRGTVYAGDTERYLRTLAKINNAAAQRADTVVRVVCGIPVYYKGTKR